MKRDEEEMEGEQEDDNRSSWVKSLTRKSKRDPDIVFVSALRTSSGKLSRLLVRLARSPPSIASLRQHNRPNGHTHRTQQTTVNAR